MEEKRLAVLIDSDNISAKYLRYIVDEISNFGTVTYKRIYGDFTNSQAKSWNEVLLKYSIVPMQQFSYTTGKNATDSAMIIDAMDILYSNRVDGFCLVSSDSDFTKLAMRIREAGMLVIGMGEKKTPEAFRNSCERFIYLENLIAEEEIENEQEETEGKSSKKKINEVLAMRTTKDKNNISVADISTVEQAIISIITDNDNQGKETGIAELGSRLIKRFKDFDVRNYGYTKLIKFVEQFDSIDVETRGRIIYVVLAENRLKLNQIEQEILEMIERSKKKKINMGEVNQKLREKHAGFNVKKYGYSQISKMVKELDSILVDGCDLKKKG